MTHQEIYDFVAAHLRKQGKKADAGRGCQYRTSEGTMCAVGCLIKEGAYRGDLEGLGVRSLIANEVLLDGINHSHRALLLSLQLAHDYLSGDFHADLENQLMALAKSCGLVYTAPSTDSTTENEVTQ